MNELIPITYENDRPTISGRDLHSFLEVGTAYKDWLPRMCEYGFLEGSDFCSFLSESTGGRPATDHQLTIEMAKEISMLQRNEKGKQARQYFIQLEKAWNTPEQVMARALRLADQQINNLTLKSAQQDQIIGELKPKADYTDRILQSRGTIAISLIAKDYGMSAQRMNLLLNELGIQYKQGKTWLLYSKYHNKGYTHSKTFDYLDSEGQQQIRLTTEWTQKGRLFLYELLKQSDILPVIEQASTTGGRYV